MNEQSERPLRMSTAWLVYCREMRDQLRDRRTLFTIIVLPMVLYPMMGSVLMQVAQFTRASSASICVVGAQRLPHDTPLMDAEGNFHPAIAEGTVGIQVVVQPPAVGRTDEDVQSDSAAWVRRGLFDVVIHVPAATQADGRPEVQVLYNVASDKSRAAYERVRAVLGQWQQLTIADSMDRQGLDSNLLYPFLLNSIDIAPASTRDTAFWSKILPFIMLVWALTGAFYPAIDLVAGEKERGTLETLLCSPALRSEIVLGKLCAVTTFSMMTSVLNVVSMLITGTFVSKQFMAAGAFGGAMGAPPLAPMLWLLVALLPLSALFSALALAVSALARSSKEGQYYLMPLMMMALPLVMLPMLPGNELSPGTSLIPVTGMFLLSRALIEGQYWTAMVHLPMVAGVTFACLWLATRWVGRQFEDESVLFRGNERWSVSIWMRHLWRDRQPSASAGQAYGCAAIILIGLFFARLVIAEMPTDFLGIAKMIMLPQVGLILAPALLMACVLTKSLKFSLGIRRPPVLSIPVALLLAVTLHPSYVALGKMIQSFYPLSDQAKEALMPFEGIVNSAPFWQVVLVLALIPAICEEIAFRGFIFSGLLQNKGRLRPVLLTAVLFGFSHGVLQQSLAATVLGLLLGWITLRTGSIIPGLLVHVTNNTLSVSLGRVASMDQPWVGLFYNTTNGVEYSAAWTIVSMCVAITCILYFAVVQPRYQSEIEDPQFAGFQPAF
jgi:sodium transport system permease protein